MKYNRLDGTQHLGNAAAERRDRRKDAALQENGYTGLRLLTQDVGKHLDDLLDAILRTISRLKRDRVTENLPP
jgi:very-short-patch-repair endonuclease